MKFNEDDIYSDAYYARVVGVPLETLAEIEIEFYKLIDFRLYIKENDYQVYKKFLELNF